MRGEDISFGLTAVLNALVPPSKQQHHHSAPPTSTKLHQHLTVASSKKQQSNAERPAPRESLLNTAFLGEHTSRIISLDHLLLKYRLWIE